MSITVDPSASLAVKTRRSAPVIFAAFTALFLAYVDLFLLLDDPAFKAVPDSFWLTYRLTFIAFVGSIAAILLTALCLIVAVSRSRNLPSALLYRRTVFPVTLITAIVSIVAWILFFTVHGFALSVLAVLSTFAIIILASSAVFSNKGVDVPYYYAAVPVILTGVMMLTLVALVANSYLALHAVAPALFSAHTIELTIVLIVMGIAALVAAIFAVRVILTFFHNP